jgi:hypothetical protein
MADRGGYILFAVSIWQDKTANLAGSGIAARCFGLLAREKK